MPQKPRKGRKVRVDFQPNRERPGREGDMTRRYRGSNEQLSDERRGESVRSKGALSRKRTVIMGADETTAVDESLWRAGTVLVVHGQFCTVRDDQGREWECTVRRVLRTRLINQRAPVTVGDRVWLAGAESKDLAGVIEKVEARRTALSRRESRETRGREHVVVANADQLLVVTSVAQPRFKPHLIDRYIVAALKGGLRPVICFTKSDLLRSGDWQAACDELGKSRKVSGSNPDVKKTRDGLAGDMDADEPLASRDEERITVGQLLEEFGELGYRCLLTSVTDAGADGETTVSGLKELRDQLKGHITVLSGQSGVGKSSLVNAIQPGLNLKVQTVSVATEKGRHATTFARLIPLDFGGFVVDTPGIRQFELWNVGVGELEAYFVEFLPYIEKCRFKDCLHTDAAGCAVREAAEGGEISFRRYISYVKMLEELWGG